MNCRTTGHLIHPDDRYVTFSRTDAEGNIVGAEEYACEPCYYHQKKEEFLSTGVLTTRLLCKATLDAMDRKRSLGLLSRDNYPPGTPLQWFDEFCADLARVEGEVAIWQRQVWFGGKHPELDSTVTEPYSKNMPDEVAYKRKRGEIIKGCIPEGSLQAFVCGAKWQGYSAKVDGVTYLSYTICGRSLFQVDAEDGASVGIILDETSPKARGGIQSIDATADRAIALLQQAVADWQAGRIQLTHDDNVGF